MPSLWTRVTMATKAAISAFRDPSAYPGESKDTDRQAYFNLLWSYYQNSTFSDINAWATYRSNFTLYRNIRSIYNPTRRIVNFYVAQVYPGVLTEDASSLPDGVQSAIPFPDDMDEDLKIAIAQFWQWSNWQAGNKLMVRYGGATGSCLVEVVDNLASGKIQTAVRWPGLMDAEALKLDEVGNLKAYALEYPTKDEEGDSYIYRKEVDQESFRYFKDDVPFDYGQGSEVENTYGFVPAVWCKHLDEGDDYGAPAIAGSIAKFDELNGLASHNHDQVDILIDSPGIIATDTHVGLIEQQSRDRKTAAQDEYSATLAIREKPTGRLLLKGNADSKWVPLVGNLEPDKVIPVMEKLIAEIEHDFPELSMYQELRKMSQVTGPGADRLLGDVKGRVQEVASNYDVQSIKLFQMAAAIGGMRFNERREGWALRTTQQAKFGSFDLESYAKGELDFTIKPRPLIAVTESDEIEMTGKRLDNAKKAQGIFSDDKTLEVAGISDEDERAEMLADRESEALAAQAAAGGLNAPPTVKGLLQAEGR